MKNSNVPLQDQLTLPMESECYECSANKPQGLLKTSPNSNKNPIMRTHSSSWTTKI